jgi:hypothetical protein
MKLLGTNWAQLDNPAESRRAHVYEVAGQPGTFRVRAENPTLHSEPTSMWWGGIVLWGHDQPTLEDAIALAAEWVEEGKLPPRL